jgi:hypothetical protein
MNNRFFYKVITTTLILSFLLGHYLLNDVFGVPYYHEGGNPVLKIHIYSYVLIFSSTWLILATTEKSLVFSNVVAKFRLFNVFLVSVVILTSYGLFSSGLGGLAFIIDTLFSSIIVMFFLAQLSMQNLIKTRQLLLLLIIANSLVALAEYIMGMNFIPREAPVWEFRSWAFLSHPLNNSLITASLVIPLMMLIDKPVNKMAFIVLMLMALLAFGGRSAFVITSLSLFFIFVHTLHAFFTGKLKVNRSYIFVFYVSIFFLPLVMFVLFDYGFGERIFSSLTIDDSASTRFNVYDVFNLVSTHELLWGAGENLDYAVLLYTGVSTIENFWIVFIMQFGLVFGGGFILVFITFLMLNFCKDFYSTLSVFSFLLIASSNNSLSVKTPALFIFIVALFLYREIKLGVRK